MTVSPIAPPTRRTFLKGVGAGVALSSLPLAWSSPAMAQTGARSLVCIFLHGGADSFNMFVPRDHAAPGQTHGVYRSTRGTMAVPASALHPIHDGDFGLHPGLSNMASMAEADRLAVVMNVGTLVTPVSRADVLSELNVPQLLFSHDSQRKLWQTSRPTIASNAGWGGAISAAIDGAGPIAPAYSIAGSQRWMSSTEVGYSRISPSTAVRPLVGYDHRERDWIPSYEGLQRAMEVGLRDASVSVNPFDRAASSAIQQSIVTTENLHEVLSGETADVGMDDVAATPLGGRLRRVAQLIAARVALGQPRQVFMVEMYGWDTHGEQATRLPELLREFDDAIGSFQATLDAMDVADSVTTFTASDFGRTLTTNGDGTDHAWGGNAFVFGGAVKSGRYGIFPNMSVDNNPDDTGDGRGNFGGRLIPTTSVAEYGATLARWMGLNEGQIDGAFPELGNFASRNLGFL